MFGLQVVGKGKCDSSLESSRREQQEEKRLIFPVNGGTTRYAYISSRISRGNPVKPRWRLLRLRSVPDGVVSVDLLTLKCHFSVSAAVLGSKRTPWPELPQVRDPTLSS